MTMAIKDADITPEQVIEAVQEGRDISLSHTDETYGPIIFSSFSFFSAEKSEIALRISLFKAKEEFLYWLERR